ncbi:GTPase [Streptococcus parauberis]|uniref:GTPase n=1 Tax=Streptococcus parauberis TaxID=1348 RepID=UPI000E37099D|nr:GTPase domain-containing protein [Streptococcus parauberis]RFE01339.1 GTP-binding protein [Streptococcus parauberis]
MTIGEKTRLDINIVTLDAFNAIEEKIKSLKQLNIIVAGKTGVGKSTLINSVFKENLADVGIGKPVTTHMRKITKKNVPLAIYDTKGFELGLDTQNEVKREIIETIQNGLLTQDMNEVIHCIWYCINTTSNRIEDEELKWLRELSEENKQTKVPIILVLTQSISKKNAESMRKMLLDENLHII